MKRLEKRDKMIAYCDECGKELTGNYSIIEYDNGRKLDFCSTYTAKINKTCLDKHNEKEFKKATE